MERVKIEALPREKTSKGSNKLLRRKGMVPAVVYGLGDETRKIILNSIDLKKALVAGYNVLLDLDLKEANDSTMETVMVKELQRHPIRKDFILHADLIRISLKEKIEVKVPLNFIGEPLGVREEGGIFQAQIREIGVRCLPTDIPEYIDVSVEDLKIGDVLTVADIVLPKDMEMLEEEDENIASVLIPVEEEEEVEEELEEMELEEMEEAEEGEEADTAEKAGEQEEE
ncbi:MAG: 50S ribosomal protein L25 [Firmicutes bacterium]|nr:50S ribosomal protein L25 [Bacillota bacterium]